jgi:ankyrin repeat protein
MLDGPDQDEEKMKTVMRPGLTFGSACVVVVLAGTAALALPSPDAADIGPAARLGRTMLLTSASVDAPDEDGRTALHYAALSGDVEAMAALLEAGADVYATDVNGDTALHIAARRLRIKAMSTLLDAGADPGAMNRAGQTVLLLLVDQGEDADELDARLAACADVLLARGVDVNARDASGATARWYAEHRGHDRLATALAAAGAKATPPTGYDPRDKADYHTYAEVAQELADAAANYPAICRVVPLGESVLGREIWAICISDNVDIEEPEREFKYISTMHGNEIIGTEMCMYFIDYVLSNYGSDPRIDRIVNETELWIVPVMNPDGFVSGSRSNANGYDLNRNFPDPYTSPNNTPDGRQPETQVIMNWSFNHSFVNAANMHSGALLVNYPFDNNPDGADVYSASPDDDLFIYISEEYSRHNPPMWNSPYYYHGITNGAAWYAISGGMQDWNYIYMGGNEVTLELADYTPPSGQLPTYWNNNRESMLAYLETTFLGVEGFVTDASTGDPVAAAIQVVGRDHNVYSDPDHGDFYRMLLPGTYDLRFEADGYDPIVVPDVVVTDGDATVVDVTMGRPAEVTHPNGGEALPAYEPTTVTWTGSPQARFQVQYTMNADDVTTTTDDFEDGPLGGEYATGGDADWYVTSGQAHGGTKAARAGSISHNQDSWMTRTVGGGDLSFWYKVSSESGYDYFNFYIDGDRVVHASGENGWVQYTTTLTDGSHTLKWEYAKDVSVNEGSDTAWIDDLMVTDNGAVWQNIVESTAPGATQVAWTPGGLSDAALVRVRALYDDGVTGTWDESDAMFTVVDGGTPCEGDLNGDGTRDLADLGILLASYDLDGGGDIDGDGDTDLADLGALLAVYGQDCP